MSHVRVKQFTDLIPELAFWLRNGCDNQEAAPVSVSSEWGKIIRQINPLVTFWRIELQPIVYMGIARLPHNPIVLSINNKGVASNTDKDSPTSIKIAGDIAELLITGKRLKDISDLPLDLAV